MLLHCAKTTKLSLRGERDCHRRWHCALEEQEPAARVQVCGGNRVATRGGAWLAQKTKSRRPKRLPTQR